ncbi:helix-turn-helix domain-containing protein [Pleionea litopenaei]|uniref:Helix-turn-helix domain-containing protein n=1 Tax=Pleionea litopenaei TaxID=3070815 RepID=A0AA51RUV5_9GAMM|nr:helix-turn-helix domain-containing protein [Pleionea sp. HL-JVS1]WMS87934.1 helix-turn-helix domain-containing protein [Pleionea sp. HL-JVS1]
MPGNLVNLAQILLIYASVLGIALLVPKRRFLGLTLFSVFIILSMFLNLLEEIGPLKKIWLVTPALLLLKGPLYYLVVYTMVSTAPNLPKGYWLHLIPSIVSILLTAWPQWIIAVATVSQIIYLYYAAKLIKFYQTTTENHRSDAIDLTLNWVRAVLFTLAILAIYDLTRLNLQPYITAATNTNGQLIGTVMGLLVYSYLLVKALKQPSYYSGLTDHSTKTELHSKEYKHSVQIQEADGQVGTTNTDKSHYQTLFQEIEKTIVAERLYLKPRLSLADVANATGFLTRDISIAINRTANQNFNDYINLFRINAIKQELNQRDSANINLLDIALEHGFNSKSSFNQVFKRLSGTTPKAFIDSIAKPN